MKTTTYATKTSSRISMITNEKDRIVDGTWKGNKQNKRQTCKTNKHAAES